MCIYMYIYINMFSIRPLLSVRPLWAGQLSDGDFAGRDDPRGAPARDSPGSTFS